MRRREFILVIFVARRVGPLPVRAEPAIPLIGFLEAAAAAINATTSIPVVAIDLKSDPVAKRYVKSLGRPGRNMTGTVLDILEPAENQVWWLMSQT
jgi:ABC-type uncharacterized transport system substrate-binding protein